MFGSLLYKQCPELDQPEKGLQVPQFLAHTKPAAASAAGSYSDIDDEDFVPQSCRQIPYLRTNNNPQNHTLKWNVKIGDIFCNHLHYLILDFSVPRSTELISRTPEVC